MTDTPFETLATKHPWPETEGVPPWDFTLGGGGRHLIDTLIKVSQPEFMLEIGCFLGASARRWLSIDPNLKLVGVDTWSDWLVQQCHKHVGRPVLTRQYPDPEVQQKFASNVEQYGPFPTALANLTEFKERFIPVRAESPAILPNLKEAGFTPDLAYIDAGKKPDDLEAVHALWPNANICGDDWHWNRTKGYPMRKIVTDFAEKYDFRVEADHATWVLYS